MNHHLTQLLKKFSEDGISTTYKKGENIIRSGEELDELFFIKKGIVRVYFLATNGQELTLHLLTQNTIFPTSNAFDGVYGQHSNYQAFTEVEIIKLSKNKFDKLIKANPQLFEYLSKQLTARINLMLEKIQLFAFGNAQGRVTSTLFYLGKQIGKTIKGQTFIDHWLTHQDIAFIAGISREKVSIVLNQFVKEGLIKYSERKVVIIDEDRLKSKLSFD